MDPTSTPSPKSPLKGWQFSWGGWLDNRHGEWWLLAQLLLIAATLLPAWPAPGSWGYAWPLPLALAGVLLLLVGLALAAQAFWRLGPSLTPLPDPKPGAALVTSGAYGRCRHPLYQAVLLCELGVALALGSLFHLGLFLASTADLRSAEGIPWRLAGSLRDGSVWSGELPEGGVDWEGRPRGHLLERAP